MLRALLRVAAALAVAALAACTDPAAPRAGVSFAGQWIIIDSLHHTYVSSFDHTTRVRAWINALTIDATPLSDTTWYFHAVTGTQTRFDTVSGQGSPEQTSSLAGLYGTVTVRGDTAYVTYLGKLALGAATPTGISFRRTYPDPECLDVLGGLAQPSPAPACRAAHHWTRGP